MSLLGPVGLLLLLIAEAVNGSVVTMNVVG